MEVFPWKLPIVTKETMDINPSIFLVYFESHLLFSAQRNTHSPTSLICSDSSKTSKPSTGGKRGPKTSSSQLPRNDHGSTSSTSSPVTWGENRVFSMSCGVLPSKTSCFFFSQQNDLSVSSSFTMYNMYPSKPHHFQPVFVSSSPKGLPFLIPLPLKTPLHLAIPGPSTPEESPAPEGLNRVTVVGLNRGRWDVNFLRHIYYLYIYNATVIYGYLYIATYVNYMRMCICSVQGSYRHSHLDRDAYHV